MKYARLAALALSIALVTPLFAGGPENYKNWGHSPQAYFTLAAAPSVIRVYPFRYASSVLGPLDILINANPATGLDRPRELADSRRLEEAFEAAARASIKVQ